MLPVGVILCMPGQYRAFPPLAVVIAARRRGMLATTHCKCSTGISAHLSTKAWRSSLWFWGGLSTLVIAWFNSPQICFMGMQSGDLAGCSILGTLPCWRKSRTTWAGEVWRYRLGSSSYPRNAAWQMAIRCFAKWPCKGHQWGICCGAQEVIWHHCEKFPQSVLNHHQLGSYKPGPFAKSAHQVNDVPLACHLSGKVGIWTRHWRWHASNEPLSGSATSVPTPNEDGGGWQSTEASLWVDMHGNHRTRAGCWWFSDQPSFHTNSLSTPSRPEHLWSDPVRPSGTKPGLDEMRSSEESLGFAWHQSSSGSMPLEDAVDGSKSQIPATSYSTLPHVLKCKHFMPNTYRVWTGHY